MKMEQVRGDGQVTHLALAGKLDMGGVQAIEIPFTAATAAAGKPALIDISEVIFVSSLGLRMFLSAYKALKAKGHRMLLFRPAQGVESVLIGAGFSEFVCKSADERTALDELLTTP